MNQLQFTTLRAGPLTLHGFSRSALSTYVMVPELDSVFDMGNCPLEAVPYNNIFLSHAHGDHSNDLLRHSRLRALHGTDPATYWMSFRISKAFDALTETTAAWQGAVRCTYLPLEGLWDTETAILNSKGPKRFVRAFPVTHRVHSLGFTILETRTKLRSEFLSLSGREIGKRRATGEVLTEDVLFPMFTYIGDCTGQSLFDQDHIWRSEVVCLECTYLLDGEEKLAEANMHTHLSEIKEALKKYYTGQHIVLKHFSLRYTIPEIKAVLNSLIQEYPTIQLLV